MILAMNALYSTFVLLFFLVTNLFVVNGQFAGNSDRTQQELNLLSWATGIRAAYCQQLPIAELIDPFREAVARMINRFCRNAAACKLKKPVTFTKHQVVLLDGYPHRENRALNFRFFVVFPHEAIPSEKRLDKPLLPQKVLSDILQTQISELTHGLGWQVLSYERYPRFDPMTSFMNRALIIIAIISFLCMLFLAYWSSTITSGSSLYSGGWSVSGSTGGKNAALRRTLEIIEEQKHRFDAAARRKSSRLTSTTHHQPPLSTVIVYKSNSRLQASSAPPRSLATSSAAPHAAMPQQAAPIQTRAVTSTQQRAQSSRPGKSASQLATPRRSITSSSGSTSTTVTNSSPSSNPPPNGSRLGTTAAARVPSTKSNTTVSSMRSATRKQPPPAAQHIVASSSAAADPMMTMVEESTMDVVPELVIMHNRDSSNETNVTARRVSAQGHRRHSRRFSVLDDFRRKKSVFGSQPSRPKRWKAGSLMFSRLSFKRPKL